MVTSGPVEHRIGVIFEKSIARLRVGRLLLPLLLCLPLAAHAQIQPVGDGSAGPVRAQHLAVEMLAASSQIAVGGQLQAGLHFVLDPGWHVYWVNAGFAGGPPHMAWTMPPGFSADPMRFPIPSRLILGPFTDFGYEREVTYPILLKASHNAGVGPAHLDAKVDWLVCSAATCIPGKAHLGLDLTATWQTAPAPAPLPEPIATALAHMPQPLPPTAKVAVNVGARDFIITLNDGRGTAHAEFYPFDADTVCYSPDQASAQVANGVRVWDARAIENGLDCSATGAKVAPAPKVLHGLIKLTDAVAYEFTAPVVPREIARPAGSATAAGMAAAQMPQPTDGSSSLPGPRPTSISLLGALGLAFLGGILLNLMPCVFPVLFLKGLALVNSSSEERGRLRRHGLVYALGILVSFWAVVGVLLVLRASGSRLGWGYQLQSSGFVAVLAAFLFFFALSLAGQFDLGLSLTSVGGDLAKKQGYTGSFFTGVLATVVATPCTGPLMGAAVGFALVQPLAVTFLIFTSLALGLAAPYVLLSVQPAWVKLLPKPGPWMEVLKQMTSLILFGAVIWLTWVYGNLAGDQAANRILMLLGCFLLLAVAGWALGRWPARRGSTIAAVLVVAAALAIPLLPQHPAAMTWKPYSAQALAEARSTGKPVFIDFTAAWCLSCQVNERLVLDSEDVKRALTARDITLLKADWTRYDDGITQQLASVGRSGVPTYVLYPSGAQSRPDVLPELLTKSVVLSAIERDAH